MVKQNILQINNYNTCQFTAICKKHAK